MQEQITIGNERETVVQGDMKAEKNNDPEHDHGMPYLQLVFFGDDSRPNHKIERAFLSARFNCSDSDSVFKARKRRTSSHDPRSGEQVSGDFLDVIQKEEGVSESSSREVRSSPKMSFGRPSTTPQPVIIRKESRSLSSGDVKIKIFEKHQLAGSMIQIKSGVGGLSKSCQETKSNGSKRSSHHAPPSTNLLDTGTDHSSAATRSPVVTRSDGMEMSSSSRNKGRDIKGTQEGIKQGLARHADSRLFMPPVETLDKLVSPHMPQADCSSSSSQRRSSSQVPPSRRNKGSSDSQTQHLGLLRPQESPKSQGWAQRRRYRRSLILSDAITESSRSIEELDQFVEERLTTVLLPFSPTLSRT